jgi:hypothetical protein
MPRNLKALGLAVGAMLVMSAALASAAQAETGALTAQKYPAIVTGQKVNAVPVFDIGAAPIRTVVCPTADLDGTLFGPTDPVTFTPTYGGCVSEPGGLPMTIAMNGCDYTVGFARPNTTGEEGATGKLTAAIDCPAGQKIEIHIYENAANHAGGVALCTYDIPPQAAVAAGVYHNKQGNPGDVEATLGAKFTAQRTVGPPMLCGGPPPTQHLPITLTGAYTLRAFDDFGGGIEGAQIGLDVG